MDEQDRKLILVIPRTDKTLDHGDDWRITGEVLESRPFLIKEIDEILRPIREAEINVKGYIEVKCTESVDERIERNLKTIIEARTDLLCIALRLENIAIRENAQLVVKVDRVEWQEIEALILITYCAIRLAKELTKARMKATGMKNPKYEMRSWLLRIGFIGEGFCRPRRLILSRLDGDAAHFSERGKMKAIARKKAARFAKDGVKILAAEFKHTGILVNNSGIVDGFENKEDEPYGEDQ